jgi:signal transduction histidine kinase
MSYLEFLNEVDLEAAEKQKFEADLLNVTRNTNELLTNLLSWSKSQMDGMSVRLESINVKQALTQTLEVLKAAAAKKNIALNYNIHPSLDITADRDMLQLITRNLVSNSIKFSSSGGEINVDCILAEDNCVLVVQDKGEGIPVEEQKKIFTAKTAPRYGTREEKGVGLGLVLCKEFTELQHGKIWFESRPGEGSAFYVSLPLFKKPALAEPGGPFSSCPPELSLLKL